MKYTTNKQRRSTGGEPLCNHRPGCRFPRGQCPDRRPVIAERPTQVYGLAWLEAEHKRNGKRDGCCKRCGLHKCACVLATRGGAKAAPVQEADALPENWTRRTNGRGYNEHYDHVSGAQAWRCVTHYGCPARGVSGVSHPTRAEAFAYALGFEIAKSFGADLWAWRKSRVSSASADSDDWEWPTAEAAADAALAFDAEQRRASKVEAKPALCDYGSCRETATNRVVGGGHSRPMCHEHARIYEHEQLAAKGFSVEPLAIEDAKATRG